METNIEKNLEKCEVYYKATYEGDEWKKAQDKAVAKLASKVTVKGFRPGKAPLDIAKKQIREIDVLESAADALVNEQYAVWSKDPDFKPFAQPELKVDEFTKEKLSYTLVVITSPSVKLGDYKGLTIEKEAVKVTAKDVDADLKAKAEANAELVVVTREAKAGDTLNIDFKGFVDGVAFEGGEAKAYDLVLGSNTFIPGFEDQLIGAKTDSNVEVNVKFPANYVENLANKDAKFEVKVNSIKEKNVPKVDDELAKTLDIEGVDTLEALKAHVKDELKTKKEKEAESKQFADTVAKIIDNATFTCSDKLILEDANRIISNLKERLSSQGLNYDDYLKMSGHTAEADLEEAKKQATANAKRSFVYQEIANAENIKVEKADIDARLEEFSKMYNMSVEDIKKQFGNNISNLYYSMLEEKVEKFIKENNNK